jgi:dihydroflavonol-4-reductase
LLKCYFVSLFQDLELIFYCAFSKLSDIQLSGIQTLDYFCNMILVTGATGLVGSHLVLHLIEQEQHVKALFRNEEGKQKVKTVFEYYKKLHLFEAIYWCEGDILDIPSLENAFLDVESVYHCAGLISFDPKDEEKLRKNNIEGTANIVTFCIDFKIKKLCHVSSTSALGDLKQTENTITEETEWDPEKQHSDYAISKYGAEMEVWRGQQEGLTVVVVNPGVILGPLFWSEGSGEIYSKVRSGLLFYTKGTTGFISVHDVIKNMYSLMMSEVAAQKFILISENKTYQELVFIITDVLKLKRPKYYASPILTSIAWRVDWFMAIFFGKKRRLSKNMTISLHTKDYYSNEKIRKLFNYQFQDINSCLLEYLRVK